MDPMSLLYIETFVKKYLSSYENEELNIIEIGSAIAPGQENFGTPRRFFEKPKWKYIGVDIEKGQNVDLVLKNPYDWRELEDNTADVVISSATFEHMEFPWIAIKEIWRVLKNGGILCLIAPSTGPEHKHPIDCWRILPDGIRALAKWSNFKVIEVFHSSGILPWEHTFSVLQKIDGNDKSVFDELVDKKAGVEAYISAIDVPPREDHILTQNYFDLSFNILMENGDKTSMDLFIRKSIALYPQNQEIKRKALEIYAKNKDFTKGMEIALLLLSSRPVDLNNLAASGKFISELLRYIKGFTITVDSRVIIENFLKSVAIECKKIIDENIFHAYYLSEIAEKIDFWMLGEIAWEKRAEMSSVNPEEFIRSKLMWAVMPMGYGFKETSQKRFNEILEYQLKNKIINRTTVIQNIINKMGYKNYVEIGVERGINFFQIRCKNKFAVDIKFKIPGGFENSESEKFYEIPSDEFFAKPPDEIVKNGIDIVLIDGGHTYKQSLKDLINSLKYLNQNGIIILHDCLPTSESCAAPTWEEATKYTDFQGAWSGEVYKTIINIRRKENIFCAVLDCDHGVGIVKKGIQENKIQMTDEEIENLTFQDLMKNKEELLNLKPKEWFWKFLESLKSE